MVYIFLCYAGIEGLNGCPCGETKKMKENVGGWARVNWDLIDGQHIYKGRF